MNVVFDTSFYIVFLRERISWERFEALVSPFDGIFLSPIVSHELFRGARNERAISEIRSLVQHNLLLEPPAREEWEKAGLLIPKHLSEFEDVGRARIQNDLLLALTVQKAGAHLLTFDSHFERIGHFLKFNCTVLEQPST